MSADRPRRRRQGTAGFTLVELMVVISIIAILATIVGFNVFNQIDESSITAAQAQIKNFETAIVAYKLKFKRFPESLDALVQNSKNIKFMNRIPEDPWGNAYVYTLEGSKDYKIVCYGADGAPGGSDVDADISSDNLGGEN